MSKLNKYKFNSLYTMSSGISSKPEQAGHGSPFASFRTIFNNYFLPDELQDLMDTSYQEQETYSIKKGDIFLTRTSETIDELGISCVAVKDYPKATFSGFVKRLRPTQDDISYHKYMGFYLRSKFFRKIMTNNAVMTLRASLNEEIFSYLDLLLPDYETQKKNGDFLFLINSKIAINNKINTELEQMAKTIYNYWFVQFDFPISAAYAASAGKPELEGKPYKNSGGKMVWNEELKREVPVGWEVGCISDISKLQSGFAFQSTWWLESGVPVLKIGNIQEDYSISFDGCSYVSEDKIKLAQDCQANPGDVIIAMTGATIGKFAIVPDIDSPILINQRVGLFKLGNNPIKRLPFLINTLKQSYVREMIFFIASGCAQPNISAAEINSIKTVIPPETLIILFNKSSNAFFELIIKNQKQNQELTRLRDFLLPLLMNGQVRVSE